MTRQHLLFLVPLLFLALHVSIWATKSFRLAPQYAPVSSQSDNDAGCDTDLDCCLRMPELDPKLCGGDE